MNLPVRSPAKERDSTDPDTVVLEQPFFGRAGLVTRYSATAGALRAVPTMGATVLIAAPAGPGHVRAGEHRTAASTR
ncbi:hypothetical protein [Streptomyces sp. AD55]|uniref:hypothetical protein n=1 Tax=Streptomyces sp. AD55 TaxID=3242895 RepID=UPI003528120A